LVGLQLYLGGGERVGGCEVEAGMVCLLWTWDFARRGQGMVPSQIEDNPVTHKGSISRGFERSASPVSEGPRRGLGNGNGEGSVSYE
jgi:hypothetical protein